MSDAVSSATNALGQTQIFRDVIGPGGVLGPDGITNGHIDWSEMSADVADFFVIGLNSWINPERMLIGTGVDFLLNFVTPLRRMIELVSGQPDTLAAKAASFQQIESQLNELAASLDSSVQNGTRDYTGEAADALRGKTRKFRDAVRSTAVQAHNMSQLLTMSSTLMQGAESFLRGVIKDFLATLIPVWIGALAGAAETFGGSVAAATATTTVEAGAACARGAAAVEKLVELLAKLQKYIMAITAAIDAIRLVDSVHAIESGTKPADDSSSVSRVTNAVGQANKIAKDAGKMDSPVGTIDGALARTGEAVGALPEKAVTRASIGSTTTAEGQVGMTADALEKQAEEGGFEKVESDQKIEQGLDGW